MRNRPFAFRLRSSFSAAFAIVSKLTETADGIIATFSGPDANLVEIPFDRVLMSVGRTPNIENLGLQELDIKYRKVAEDLGFDQYIRANTLQAHPLFIDCLKEDFIERLNKTTFQCLSFYEHNIFQTKFPHYPVCNASQAYKSHELFLEMIDNETFAHEFLDWIVDSYIDLCKLFTNI